MAISHHATGSWAYAASGSVTPTLPTHSTGDMLIARVAYKSSAIATCAATTATSGWAKVGEKVGTGNSGNGTGGVTVAAFWKVAASASDTAPTIDFSQTVTQVGHVAISYSKGAGDLWSTPVGDGGEDTTADTSKSMTIATHVSVTTGDWVDFFLGIRDDCTVTSPTFTQTGATLAAVSEQPATAGTDTSGADGAYDGGYRSVTAGTSSAAAVVTATLNTSETGTAWTTRLRVSVATDANAENAAGTGASYNATTTISAGGVGNAAATGAAGAATANVQPNGRANGDWRVRGRATIGLNDGYGILLRATGSDTGWSAGIVSISGVVTGQIVRSHPVDQLTLATVDLSAYSYNQEWTVDFEVFGPPSTPTLRARFYPTAVGELAWTETTDNYVNIPRTDDIVRSGGTEASFASWGDPGAWATAYRATTTIATSGGNAAATGVANQPAISVAPAGGHASATGQAFDATAETAVTTNADAGNAAASGAASSATTTIDTNAGHAAATGAAGAATVNVQPNAGQVSATGSAYSATTTIVTNAGHAAAAGAAYDATVSTAAQDEAPAELAAATGASNQPSVSVSVNAGHASAIAAAFGPSASVALGPDVAAATGAAYDATVAVSGNTNVDAGHASAIATAWGATADNGEVVIPPLGGHMQAPAPTPQHVFARAGAARAMASTGGSYVQAEWLLDELLLDLGDPE